MSPQPPEPDLVALERAVRSALRRSDPSGLRVLGRGEITLVLGEPADAPRWACKRLPVFRDPAAARAYRETFDRYLEVLEQRGVRPVPSRFQALGRPGARDPVIGWVIQPALDPEHLAARVLAGTGPDPEHPVLTGVAGAVVSTCDRHTGLDAQLSNWAWDGSTLSYLDLTTPLLFDDRERLEFDTEVFLSAYPWVLRRPIDRFVAPGVVGAYRDPRHVLVDFAANLVKERLEHWIPAAVTVANRVLGLGHEPVTEAEVRRYYRTDARMWEALLRLRRADQWWQRHVRRRTYPFLLPDRIER